ILVGRPLTGWWRTVGPAAPGGGGRASTREPSAVESTWPQAINGREGRTNVPRDGPRNLSVVTPGHTRMGAVGTAGQASAASAALVSTPAAAALAARIVSTSSSSSAVQVNTTS